MKKLVLFVSLMGMMVLSSCCNCNKKCDGQEKGACPDQKPACEMRHQCTKDKEGQPGPKCELMEKWAKFDEMSLDEQKALIKETKAGIDKRDSIRRAQREEFKKNWENFDNLSIDEQKALLQQKMFKEACRHHHGPCPQGPCPGKPGNHKPCPGQPAPAK